jgi:hypothetical protein
MDGPLSQPKGTSTVKKKQAKEGIEDTKGDNQNS